MRRWSQIVPGLFAILCIAGSGLLPVRADRATFDPTRTQVARRLPAPPTIDGVVNPAEWERAGGNNDYWQVTPDTSSWVPDGIRGGVVGDVTLVPDNADDLSFRILAGYDDNYLYVAVRVTDNVISTDSAAAGSVNGNTWLDDSVEVFVDGANTNEARWAAGQIGGQYVITANNAYREMEAGNPGYGTNAAWYAQTALTATGYEAEFRIALTNLGNPKPGDIIGFTVGVNDDDGDPAGGVGTREHQLLWVGKTHQPVTYGNLMLGPSSYTAPKVTTPPNPNGMISPGEYSGAAEIHVNAQMGIVYVPGGDDDLPLTDLDYKVYVVHDDNAVYFAVDVTDDVISSDTVDAAIAAGMTQADGFHTWEDDSVELFFDLDNSQNLAGATAQAPGVFEGQYTLTPQNTYFNGSPSDMATNGFQWFGKASLTPTGYQIEFKIPKSTLGSPTNGASMGFHVAVNDDDKVGDYSHVGWPGQAHHENTYGTLTLAGGSTISTPFRIVEIKPDFATGNIMLSWEGGNGPQFQIEKATALTGPFQPLGAPQTARSFTDPGVLKTNAQSFYRIR